MHVGRGATELYQESLGYRPGRRCRMALARAILPCLIAGVAAGLLVADDAALFTTIDPILCTSTLEHLRETLGQVPASDPRLASAEMALVDLALSGDPRDCAGRGGVWRQRARELRNLRRKDGTAEKTLAGALPDIWVDALDGAIVPCLAALDRFPAADKEPQARAVRCWATGDWRALSKRENPSVHERLALAAAYSRCQMQLALEHLDRTGLPPLAFAAMQNATSPYSEEGNESAWLQALRLVPAIISSPQLPASTEAAVGDLRRSLNLTKSTPPPLLPQALSVAMVNGDAVYKQAPFVAGMRIVNAAISGPSGIRDGGGAWVLIGLGDAASYARLALFLASWHRHDFMGITWEEHETGGAILDQISDADHGIFGGIQLLLASQYKSEDAGRQVLKGIEAELAQAAIGIPPCRLIACAEDVRRGCDHLANESKQVMEHLFAAQRAAESGRAAGWEEIGRQARSAGMLSIIAADLQQAASADPWSSELERLALESRTPGNRPTPEDARDDALQAAQITRMPWRLDLQARTFEALFQRKRFADAEKIGAEILALDPGNNQVLKAYGRCLQELKREPDAIKALRANLDHGETDESWKVHLELGKSLERMGDVDGAEREYALAAMREKPAALFAFIDFLMQRKRGADALVWVEKEIVRWGDDDVNLLAATCMLMGTPKPQLITTALERMAAYKGFLASSRFSSGLFVQLRHHRLYERVLPIVDDSWRTARNGIGAQVALLKLEAGHPVEAASWFSTALGSKHVRPEMRGWLMAMQSLAARLAKRPDLAVPAVTLRSETGHGASYFDSRDALLHYLAGDCDRATALVEAGTAADELRYYLGIDAAAAGDVATARAYWQAVVKHEDWDEAEGALRMLDWLGAGAQRLDTKVPGAADF